MHIKDLNIWLFHEIRSWSIFAIAHSLCYFLETSGISLRYLAVEINCQINLWCATINYLSVVVKSICLFCFSWPCGFCHTPWKAIYRQPTTHKSNLDIIRKSYGPRAYNKCNISTFVLLTASLKFVFFPLAFQRPSLASIAENEGQDGGTGISAIS